MEIYNPILEDTLQEGLSLDTATVQLFELNIDSDGFHTVGNEVELTGDNIEYNDDTRLFKFHFDKTITNAYLLKFQTDIASTHKDTTFNNSISFQGSHGDETGDSKKITVEVQEVGGGASGRNGSLTLTKVDKDKHEVKLENGKFQLFNRFGDAIGDIKSTDQAGIVVFDKLKFGIPYIIKEIEAPEGYVVDENAEYKFTLSSEEKDIAYSMENEMVKGNIEFKKIDKDTKDPIKGAIFEIFEESNTDIPIAEDTSSAKGTVSFKDVAYGRYVIKEKTPAEGYLKTSVMLKANILENGETVYAQPEGSSSEALYELENTSIKGNLKIIKTDEKDTSKKLQNAEFKIFKVTDSGELYVDTIETSKDGVAQIDDLVYGEYIVREVKAPEGYYINNKDYNVTITDNGMTVELQVENKKIPVGTLVINKLDAWSGEGLVGVEFGIYNKDDDLIKKFITDEKGIANVDNLETGIYTVKEMDIPEGYHELYVEETVEIKTDESTTVTIENHPLRTLVIKKIDKRNTDKALSGAVFEVKNEEGKIIGEIVTNDDGLAKIEGLVFGEYTIKETKAPNRYRLDSTDFTVNIDKQTPVIYEIQRENAKKRNSGGGGSKDPDPDPKPDSEPGPEPDPEPDVDPELDPNPDPEEPVIEEDTSVDGELDVPEDSNPELGTPPENGKVTIDEKGKWTYTPNPGFVGKDKFTIKIKYPDGTEEEKFIEIDVEDIPLGRAPGAGDETLPQTGEQNHSTMYLIGAFLIALGIELKRRNINKSKM